MREKLRGKKWYDYAVAACIAVVLFVVLTHLTPIMKGLWTFLGYFKALIIGCLMAYLMNPLAKYYQRVFFKKMNNEKTSWSASVILTVVTVVLFILFLLGTLIPQLADSITMLVSNMDGYIASLLSWAQKTGIDKIINLDQLIDTSGNSMNTILSVIKDNLSNIIDVSVSAGKGAANIVIAAIVSVYLLASKSSLKSGTMRLLHALMPEKRYNKALAFYGRCDKILVQYIVFSILDSLIVFIANAIFMACLGMQYVGLVSLIVAVTNLIPTFGPIIGCVVGGFILLLVNPVHAAMFVVFSLLLQFLDGYIIKPKLFGNSLGVSGLLILAAVIVCGGMFGIAGMLLAIPLAAILDFVYSEEFLPALERKRKEDTSASS